MIFFAADGKEVDVTTFEPNSIVIVRVTKPMSEEDFRNFCKTTAHVHRLFQKRGVTLLLCPDWIEFKEWK